MTVQYNHCVVPQLACLSSSILFQFSSGRGRRRSHERLCSARSPHLLVLQSVRFLVEGAVQPIQNFITVRAHKAHKYLRGIFEEVISCRKLKANSLEGLMAPY